MVNGRCKMGCREFFSLILLLSLLALQINCSTKREPLPEKISGLELSRKMTGDTAKESINKLHFQPVTETENQIGFYKGNIGEAVIYATRYHNSEEPKVEFEKMTRKISPENSVFFNPSFFEQNGKNIYQCFGMGMTHFVFYDKHDLFWVSVDTHIAIEFLKNYLKYLTN